MAKKLVTQSDLAALKGVSRQAVSRAVKGRLAPALVGSDLDLNHPEVQRYLKRGAKGTAAPGGKGSGARKKTAGKSGRAKKVAPERRQTAPDAAPTALQVTVHEIGPDEVLDMTLREVGRRFGSNRAFKHWLDSIKQIEDIRDKRLKNDRSEGSLVPREPIAAYIFGAIDAVNRRMLSDAPKTIARRLVSLAKSDAALEECERAVREIISSQLKPLKARARKHLAP